MRSRMLQASVFAFTVFHPEPLDCQMLGGGIGGSGLQARVRCWLIGYPEGRDRRALLCLLQCTGNTSTANKAVPSTSMTAFMGAQVRHLRAGLWT